MRPWVKVARDLRVARGRVVFMVLALAAGLTSLGTVLSMRGVLGREMTRSYLESVPASAILDTGLPIDDALLAELRARPDVAAATRRATRTARWRRPGAERWGRGILFVLEDYTAPPVATLGHERGARVPPPGGVLVERSAMAVLGAEIGDVVELTTGRGEPIEVRIAGVVHEPALAPAATEQAGYFYASAETLARLEGEARLDELRVLVADDPLDPEAVDRQVRAAASWLASRGAELHEVQVPPPGAHPHQAPSDGVLLLLVTFAGLTVLLAAVLAVSLMSTLMARQVREVAVMKTLGATAGRIRAMYALMVGSVATLALLVAAAPTLLLARLGIDRVAAMLNIDVASYELPWWVHATQVAVALGLPLLAAAPAIARASRASVRTALADHGAPAPRRVRWLDGISDRLLGAALRNAFRVPRRLALTVGLLGVGGALFVAAVSVADAWGAMTDEVRQTRHYDAELRFAVPPDDAAIGALRVERAERWGFAPVTLASASGLPLSRTYPDGAHGSMRLVGVPDATELVDFELLAGRWLEPGDERRVVLNQLAAARVAPDPIGRRVELVVDGRHAEWEVVGVVEEVAAPATVYAPASAFVARTGRELAGLRVVTGAERGATLDAIDALVPMMEASGARVVSAAPLELLYDSMAEHVAVLIALLIGLAILMGVVSALALGSSTAASVVERTRELGAPRDRRAAAAGAPVDPDGNGLRDGARPSPRAGPRAAVGEPRRSGRRRALVRNPAPARVLVAGHGRLGGGLAGARRARVDRSGVRRRAPRRARGARARVISARACCRRARRRRSRSPSRSRGGCRACRDARRAPPRRRGPSPRRGRRPRRGPRRSRRRRSGVRR